MLKNLKISKFRDVKSHIVNTFRFGMCVGYMPSKTYFLLPHRPPTCPLLDAEAFSLRRPPAPLVTLDTLSSQPNPSFRPLNPSINLSSDHPKPNQNSLVQHFQSTHQIYHLFDNHVL